MFKTKLKRKVKGETKNFVKWASRTFWNEYYGSLYRKRFKTIAPYGKFAPIRNDRNASADLD